MFFPATEQKRTRKQTSFSTVRKRLDTEQKLPSLSKHQRLSIDKQNWQPKLLKIAKSQNLVLNFKPRRQKLVKLFQNRVMMEILTRKIDPWDVSQSPQLQFSDHHTLF